MCKESTSSFWSLLVLSYIIRNIRTQDRFTLLLFRMYEVELNILLYNVVWNEKMKPTMVLLYCISMDVKFKHYCIMLTFDEDLHFAGFCQRC